MHKSLSTAHNLLTYYLQTLNDAEMRQIIYLTHSVEADYSTRFNNFLCQQQQATFQQHNALKSLESILGIHLLGGKCEPIRELLLEAEKVNNSLRKNPDLMESILAQLMQRIKHYEVVTYQAALVVARNLGEKIIVSTLAEILEEEDRLYLQLQNFIMITNSRQKKKLTAEMEAAEALSS